MKQANLYCGYLFTFWRLNHRDSKTSCVNSLQCCLEVFALFNLGAKDLKAVTSNNFIDININFSHAERRILEHSALKAELSIVGISKTPHISTYYHFFTLERQKKKVLQRRNELRAPVLKL